MRHRDRANILADIIKTNHGKTIAEIGVALGSTTICILDTCDIDEYWAIDIWQYPHRYVDVYRGEIESILKIFDQYTVAMDKAYSQACVLMTLYNALRVIKLDSVSASRLFNPNYFDLVYIDAAHDLESVRNDIKAWLPHIRKDGIICGHDYDDPQYPGVKIAVDEKFGDKVNVYPEHTWVVKIEDINGTK